MSRQKPHNFDFWSGGRLARLTLSQFETLVVQASQTPPRSCSENLEVQRKYRYRRNLPHLQWQNRIYFLTFCTHKRQPLTAGARDRVLETCLSGNGKLFDLHAAVVMPDHVHLVLTPLCDENGMIAIQEITQAIKGASAHRINKYLGRKGRIWQAESFDRAMRKVENTRAKIEYILGNPVRAGLVQNPFDYRWLWTEK